MFVKFKDMTLTSYDRFMLCRPFIKGVGGGSKNKKVFFFSKITLYFSFKRVDIDYITNYKINQNVGKTNICIGPKTFKFLHK